MAKKKMIAIFSIVLVTSGIFGILWSSGQFSPSDTKIITHDFVELDKIESISKFRSCQGHEYGSDESGEVPSSMKHYYNPKFPLYNNTNDTIKLFACFDGKITELSDWEPFIGGGEGRGRKMTIKGPQGYSAIYMHISILDNITNGKNVKSGDWLGFADCRSDSPTTTSNFDICIHSGNNNQYIYSYFNFLTDEVFSLYQAKGITTRSTMIITAEDRIANECECGTPDPNHPDECRFTNAESSDWVILS